MLARVRKALVTAAGTGLATGAAALVQAAAKGSITQADVIAAIGLAIPAALTVGLATYGVRNAGLPGGSEPKPTFTA